MLRRTHFPFRSLSLSTYTNPLHHPPIYTGADIIRLTSSITASFRRGDIPTASRIFNSIHSKNTITYNCMISGYAHHHLIADAQRVFNQMPTKDIISWASLLMGYAKCGRIKEARNIFDTMPERNIICWNSMVSGYINNGLLREARELFDVMPVRNSVTWSIMISGYLKSRRIFEARVLFERSPSRATSLCNALLSGYVELGLLYEARELFGQMVQRNVVSWNTIIAGYSRAGDMEFVRRLFEEMPEKDVVSWTTVVRGYLRNGDVEAARRIFCQMPKRDIMAWNTMMGGYVEKGLLEDALELFSEMPEKDIVSWNTILQGYVQGEDMVGACIWFETMPWRSETSWNTLISGYRNEKALVLFSEMIRDGLRPNQSTFAVVISVCASIITLGLGKMVHLRVVRGGYENDTMVMSSLVAMYSRCGLVGDASLVFQCISKRDTIAWNAMIATCAYHGFATKAFELLDELIHNGFRPDHATFLSILFACSHKGLVDKGFRYFKSMQDDWKLVPKPEHYSCVVDLLGRSGHVNEAYSFTSKIPDALQSNAWETLLSVCRFHGNLELGEIAAKRVLHAQPFDGGMYIILSNIYAAKGMWKDSASTRASMKDFGVKKEIGCSLIEVKGELCSFVSNDKSHPLTEVVCRELDNLSILMEAIT